MSERSIRRNRKRRVKRLGTRVTRGAGRGTAAAAVAIGGAALVAPAAEAATFTVENTNDAGPDSLRDAITTANGNGADDTIVFNSSLSGDTITLTTGEIPIDLDDGNLEIQGLAGRAPTVSGNDASRIFNAYGAGALSISLLDFEDGYAPYPGPNDGYGGAIYSESELSVTDSSFSGNVALNSGGAIYAGAPLTLDNADLSNNTSYDPGTADAEAGGAVAAYDDVAVRDSSFETNYAGYGGGLAVYGPNTLTIENSTFNDNEAYTAGGGLIAAATQATISGSEFTGNTSGYYGGGTALSGAIVDFDDVSVEGNEATVFGGGVAALATEGTIDGTTISDNTVNGYEVAGPGSPTFGFGAGLFAYDPSCCPGPGNYALEIEGSAVDDNNLPADFGVGAGVVASGATTISGSTVSGNSVTQGIAGISGKYGTTIANSTVSGNSTGAGIGGIAAKYGMTIDRSTIDGNVTGDQPGSVGGIATKYDVTISRSTISGNEGAVGGVTSYVDSGGPPDPADAPLISNSTISGNSAIGSSTGSGNRSGYGGGIYVRGQVGPTIQNSTVAGNTASQGGGGIFSYPGDYSPDESADTILSSTIVADNTAAGAGNDLAGDDSESPGTGFTAGFSLIENPGSAELSSDPAGSNIFGQDPKLGNLADNGGPTETLLPENSSPAVDKGTANGLTVDQRGEPRTTQRGFADASDGTDIGSVELPADATAPTTTITSGPGEGEIVIGDSVDFAFEANEQGSTFECMLDSGNWSPCTSPKTYDDLSSGDFHTFKVRATDEAGNTGPAASRTFKTVGGFCNGTPATIVAKPGIPTIGTPGPDVIAGTDGADEIRGLGGDDQICAAGGDDLVLGGEGDDEITGDQGADQINGNDGDDGLFGATGPDLIIGAAGDDQIEGANGDDRLRGKDGDDEIIGRNGLDDIRGNSGSDELSGGADDDVVRGDADDDLIKGNGGSDELRGAAGDDEIRGAGKPDDLFGGKGDDLLNGGKGRNSCNGGPGKNKLVNCG